MWEILQTDVVKYIQSIPELPLVYISTTLSFMNNCGQFWHLKDTLGHYFGNILSFCHNSTENVNKTCASWDSHWRPPKYESTALPTTLTETIESFSVNTKATKQNILERGNNNNLYLFIDITTIHQIKKTIFLFIIIIKPLFYLLPNSHSVLLLN